jgi:hypothetical protein
MERLSQVNVALGDVERCVICNRDLTGRVDQKTCSARCRKRLERRRKLEKQIAVVERATRPAPAGGTILTGRDAQAQRDAILRRMTKG